jgi:RES domain-containing protein
MARVPSAVVKGDFNYLLNPNHVDFKTIKIQKVSDFLFDNRLF